MNQSFSRSNNSSRSFHIKRKECDDVDGHHQLDLQQKWQICCMVWKEYVPEKGSYPANTFKTVSKELGISETIVKKVQEEYFQQMSAGVKFPDLTPKEHGHKTSRLPEKKMEILDSFRQSKGEFYYQEQSMKLHIPQTTLFRWMLNLGIRNATSYVKPLLTLSQQLKRVKFILHQLEDPNIVERYLHDHPSINANHFFTFKSFANHVWIDEAWFYLMSMKGKRKELPEEPRFPDQQAISKMHIPKVMFLLAVGLPHILPDGTAFDGKIGLWDITKEVPAKRKSKNRPKGTLETKSTSMTAKEFKDRMTDPGGVFDTIEQKLGCYFKNPQQVTINVQQDGAKPHIAKTIIPAIQEESRKGKRLIAMQTQPPQSPDLNVLDLAFINSIKKTAKYAKYEANGDVKEFVRLVKESFSSYSSSTLSRICALQYVAYREILKVDGGNQYDMPHTGIRKRQKQNPESCYDCADVRVSASLIKTAVDFYERETGTSFPWSHHPDYRQEDVVSVFKRIEESAFDPSSEYFDECDSDEADDPSDDRSVDSENEDEWY